MARPRILARDWNVPIILNTDRCQCVFPGRTCLFLSVWVKWTKRKLQKSDLTVCQSQTKVDKDLTLDKHRKPIYKNVTNLYNRSIDILNMKRNIYASLYEEARLGYSKEVPTINNPEQSSLARRKFKLAS